MEIERKFLVSHLPDGLERFPSVEIEQTYLCTSPTLRIRRAGDAYILTVKEHKPMQPGGPIVNREEEFDLTAESYALLRGKCLGGMVQKRRYRIPLEAGLTAELDVFAGRHEGLALVEVEFPDEAAAFAFEKPEWFGDDVSAAPQYRNSFLASIENQ